MTVQLSLCLTWSEGQKLIYEKVFNDARCENEFFTMFIVVPDGAVDRPVAYVREFACSLLWSDIFH